MWAWILRPVWSSRLPRLTWPQAGPRRKTSSSASSSRSILSMPTTTARPSMPVSWPASTQCSRTADVTWNLECRDLPPAEVADFILSCGMTLPQANPGAHDFSVFLIRNSDDLHIAHLGVRVQKLLDLARINILAASNDHVLQSADDI